MLLLLTADSPLVDVLLATYLLGVGALIVLTKGRLGYEGAPSELTD